MKNRASKRQRDTCTPDSTSFVSLKQFQLERTNEKEKKMRSTVALSRMRHTSHIPCHAQRAHLWAARHGCKRTCALHRQSKRAMHTGKKPTTCSTCSCIEMSALQRPKTTIQSQPLGIARMRVRQSSLCTRSRTHGCQNSCPRSSWSKHGGFTQDAIQRAPHIMGLRVVPRTNSPEKLLRAKFW